MFRIKICGITQPVDAVAAAAAGADAIGLNFYPRSKRFVADDVADEIILAVTEGVLRVGVFVNSPAEQVVERVRRFKLSGVQLHGNEPPEYLRALGDVSVVVALRAISCKLNDAIDHVAACRRAGNVAAVLWDAPTKEFGGTGALADWSAAIAFRQRVTDVPLILAGGLTPENVASAIKEVQPYGVDVATGVEASPGLKDASLLSKFVAAARSNLST